MAAMTLSGCVARVDPARDDLLIPRFIFCVLEDAPLHPVGSFAVPPVAILPLLRTQVPQVLEDEDGSPCSQANWTIRALTRWATCSSMWRILRQRSALSCSFSAMMPVCDRWRAIRPNCLFLKPDIALPSPINRVARIVPSTVYTVHTAKCWSRLRSTAQIRVSALVMCSAMFGGLVNVFSVEVCSHHCSPRRTRTGL